MFVHVDPQNGLPLYRQIMSQIKHSISSGHLKAGDKLPSVRELAQTIHISPITIVKAYEELEREGVILTQRGKGTFVAEGGSPLRERERREVLRRQIRELLANAWHLDIDEGEIVEIVKEELRKQKGANRE